MKFDRQKWQEYADNTLLRAITPTALANVIHLYFYPMQCGITDEQKHLYRLAATEAYDKLIERFPKSDIIPRAKRSFDLVQALSN